MKRWRRFAVLAAAVCALGTGIYQSSAYMNTRSQEMNHLQFVGEDGLNAVLTEPSWDPEKGLKVIPNMAIPKDPQVTNTSDIDMDALVALKAEFVYTESCPDKQKAGKPLSDTDMGYVSDVFKIDYNADDPDKGDWVRFEGQDMTDAIQCFYYKSILERNLPGKGDTTIPLFTSIRVDKSVNNGKYSHVQDIGGFNIRISGHVIQQMTGEEYFGLNSAKEAYQAGLFDFKPENEKEN